MMLRSALETTIDRGALNDTVIGDGVKLDNQVQIGHGTEVGANTAISGCTAIAREHQNWCLLFDRWCGRHH